MEDDAGGSSQDRYESDFINDDGREEIEQNKARRLKKGHLDSSDEEQFMLHSGGANSTSKNATVSKKAAAPQVIHSEEEKEEESEDEADPYDELELV